MSEKISLDSSELLIFPNTYSIQLAQPLEYKLSLTSPQPYLQKSIRPTNKNIQ